MKVFCFLRLEQNMEYDFLEKNLKQVFNFPEDNCFKYCIKMKRDAI